MSPVITQRDQIINGMRSRLLANEWPAGTRLKEAALAEQFGVSRGPIRDVLLELTKEGYLRMLPNKGVTVSGFPESKARQIYLTTRRDLEALALKEGFAQWPGDAMGKLGKILRFFESAAKSDELPEVIEHDISFHRFIIEHYAEENLAVVWLPLMTTLALPYSRHRNLLESYAEHANIYGLLQQGKLTAAVSALRKHIQ